MPPEKLDLLLEKICVEWGFCLSPDDAQRILDMTEINAERFAEAVLAGERITDRSTWKVRLEDAFAATL